MINRSSRTPAMMLLMISMLSFGFLAVLFGKELCWDLANYHYYNPFALLNDRDKMDYFPVSFIHQFINPVPDLFSYVLINHFTPRMTEFILGTLSGVNFWLLYLIANEFIESDYRRTISLLVSVIGMYGPLTFPGIGSFQNDSMVAIFVLGFVYFAVKDLRHFASHHTLSNSKLFLAGFILGLGFGLKLTVGPYLVGGFFAYLFLSLSTRQRIQFISMWAVGVFFGFLFTGGYWSLHLWNNHHNPFFPYFNNLFHSADASPLDMRDKAFMPNGIWQTLFYPFYFAWDGRTANFPFRDFRFPLIYLLFIIACIHRFRSNNIPIKYSNRWLYIFFIFSYVAWQICFSIARYLAPLEMLAPLIIYLLIAYLIKPNLSRIMILTIIFYSLVYFMVPSKSIRSPSYGPTFFNVKLPEMVKRSQHATVLIAYTAYLATVDDIDPRPQTYLIPFFPSEWHFIGVPFSRKHYLADAFISNQIARMLQTNKGDIYLLTTEIKMPDLYEVASHFGLRPNGACEQVVSDRNEITGHRVSLCPVTMLN